MSDQVEETLFSDSGIDAVPDAADEDLGEKKPKNSPSGTQKGEDKLKLLADELTNLYENNDELRKISGNVPTDEYVDNSMNIFKCCTEDDLDEKLKLYVVKPGSEMRKGFMKVLFGFRFESNPGSDLLASALENCMLNSQRGVDNVPPPVSLPMVAKFVNKSTSPVDLLKLIIISCIHSELITTNKRLIMSPSNTKDPINTITLTSDVVLDNPTEEEFVDEEFCPLDCDDKSRIVNRIFSKLDVVSNKNNIKNYITTLAKEVFGVMKNYKLMYMILKSICPKDVKKENIDIAKMTGELYPKVIDDMFCDVFISKTPSKPKSGENEHEDEIKMMDDSVAKILNDELCKILLYDMIGLKTAISEKEAFETVKNKNVTINVVSNTTDKDQEIYNSLTICNSNYMTFNYAGYIFTMLKDDSRKRLYPNAIVHNMGNLTGNGRVEKFDFAQFVKVMEYTANREVASVIFNKSKQPTKQFGTYSTPQYMKKDELDSRAKNLVLTIFPPFDSYRIEAFNLSNTFCIREYQITSRVLAQSNLRMTSIHDSVNQELNYDVTEDAEQSNCARESVDLLLTSLLFVSSSMF